jgi:hypothetical protein
MHFFYSFIGVKAWTEAHFLLGLHTKNVPRSTLLHAYKTTKKCIQFLIQVGI